MKYTMVVPLDDMPPCAKLWDGRDVLKLAEAVVRESVRKASERMQEEFCRWMVEGEVPYGVVGLVGDEEGNVM